ncbi:MAG: hypothetical protein AAB372_04155 [Patescibacteria group bacterium]
MITEREQEILELLVREYIRTAEPVSSERVASRMRRTLSSASIRNIFSDLTDAGFIEQPHVSGGRVPKSRGYRFFVEKILEDESSASSMRSSGRDIDRIDGVEELQEMLAESFHVLSACTGGPPIGFRELLREPEFNERGRVEELGTVLDGFREYEEAYAEELRENPFEIIIGDENEIHPISHMTVMMTQIPDERTLFITGPTRMQYDRIIHVMNIWQTKKKKK